MLELISEFNKIKQNADKLAEFYFNNFVILTELKNRFPQWENYVSNYLTPEVQAELRDRGVPI